MNVGRALALLVAGLFAAVPARALPVSGQVVSPDGAPVEYAAVSVASLGRGAAADAEGRFTLDLPPGSHVIEFAQLGFERARLPVEVREGMAPLRVVLRAAPVPVDEVVVTASTFGKAGKTEGAVVRRGDVISTPGGAADIFQALRALPGINAPNEGAAVFVRGGDPRETLIRLDGGEIGHPYHYEGASGGLFSTIDSYMLKSALFSSGGFGARYGGVLSGVLDIETQDPMNLKTVSLGANLAGGSASTSWALVPDRLSLVASVSHSFPELLFRLYGSASEYETAPSSGNGFGKLLLRYSPTGRLILGGLHATDRVGVQADHLNVRYVYDEDAETDLGMLQLQEVLGGRVALRAQVAGQTYESRWGYGPFGASRQEANTQANVDLVWPFSDRHELSIGGNLRHLDTRIVGAFPADSTDLVPDAEIRFHQMRPLVDHVGVYVEQKSRVWGPVYATLGVRFDHLSTPGLWTADPRAALAWRLDPRQTLRVAGGRYHQAADPRLLDPVYGNPRLGPLAADHAIAGYEWASEHLTARVEGFRKEYRDLPTQDVETFYANEGHGFARGVDVFLQGSSARISGWISYGYLDSKRKELDDPEEVPASYGVRHSLTWVALARAGIKNQVGVRYNVTSGRPYTPVVSSSYDPERNLWHPVYGDHNSDRMPLYRRLDVRFTRLFSLPAAGRIPSSNVCAFYVEAINVLGIRNVLDYIYALDYSSRYSRESYFSRRLVVAGLSLTW